METRFTIDWLSATFKPADALSAIAEMNLGDEIPNTKKRAQFGYNRIAQYSTGATLSWHSERSEMGAHLSISGSALREIWAGGHSPLALLQTVYNHDGRTSRVDVALDIYDGGVKPSDLCKLPHIRIEGKGRQPKKVLVLGGNGADTLYIGSRQSEKFMRIYDKAKEQKNWHDDIIRVELELKGMTAHAFGAMCGQADEASIVATALTMMRGTFYPEQEQYRSALNSPVSAIAIPKTNARDTFGWLLKICAPALARLIAEKPHVDVLSEFNDALTHELLLRGFK